MKILFLSRLFHPHVGGVETHVLELSRQLIKKGHSVTIITEGYDEKLKERQIYQDIEIFRIPLSDIKEESKKFAIWEWLFAHKNLLKTADIIHIHDVAYWLFPMPWYARKIYITFHGYEGSNPPSWSAIVQRKIGEFYARKTINIGAFMTAWYHAKPDQILYGATTQLPSARKTKDAVYIGRLHEDTGIMVYLSVLNFLKKKNFNLKLDVFGDGPQRDEAVHYAKKFKLPVAFHGFSKDAAKNLSQYRFALVSRYLSILEAMSLRIPVFAVFNNQIKHDYLACHPQAENMVIESQIEKLAISLMKWQKPTKEQQLALLRAQQWAKDQTWSQLTKNYLALWSQ